MENNTTKYELDLRNTKEKIRNAVLADKSLIEKNAETDAVHSAAYYHSLYRLIDEFINKLDSVVLFNKLEPDWQYRYDMSYKGISLDIEHISDYVEDMYGLTLYDVDQRFELFSISARFLTVEEYAKQYGVADGTVRQWIRRAKIRTAKKYGTEWRISELTDPPKRGYTEGHYKWEEPLSYLPDEFQFLKGYSEIHISQCKDRQKYQVALFKDEESHFYDESREITTQEREKLELFLIGNPEVILCQNFTEAPVWDLIRYYNSHTEEFGKMGGEENSD